MIADLAGWSFCLCFISAIAFHSFSSLSLILLQTRVVENILDARASIPDRILYRTTGAMVLGPHLVRTSDSSLQSTAPSTQIQLAIFVVTEQTASAEEWISQAAAFAMKVRVVVVWLIKQNVLKMKREWVSEKERERERERERGRRRRRRARLNGREILRKKWEDREVPTET